MSDSVTKDHWKLWLPKKIYLNTKHDNQTQLYYNQKYMDQDLYSYKDYKKNAAVSMLDNNLYDIKKIKKESYDIGFKKGCEKYKHIESMFKNKIQKIILDFENSLFMNEKLLFDHLLKTILTVSFYLVGHKPHISESHILKVIKKIVKNDTVFLKKPKIILHPDNKQLIENIFLNSSKLYTWKIVYNKNIDVNSCQVSSESGGMDSTINARWQELCRFINLEEY